MAGVSEAQARSAWQEVASGVVGANNILAELEAEFVALIVSGSETRKLELKLVELLGGHAAWQWPWFEEWLLVFDAAGLWPYMWPELEPEDIDEEDYTPEELAQFRRGQVASLIVHTASGAAYRNMRVSEGPSDRLGYTLSSIGDAAEEHVVVGFRAAVESGDLSRLPPFFPGDRTGLTYKRIERPV